MVRQCFKCQKLDFLNPNLTFHKFPKEPDKRNMWIKILNLETRNVPKICVICSDHFDENDLTYNPRGVCVLKDDYVVPKSTEEYFAEGDDSDSFKTHFQDTVVKTEVKAEVPETLTNPQNEEGMIVFENSAVKNEILDDEEDKRTKENMFVLDQPSLVQIKFESSEIGNEIEKMEEYMVKHEELIVKEEQAESSISSTHLCERKEENEENNQSNLLLQLVQKNEGEKYEHPKCSFVGPNSTDLKLDCQIKEHSCLSCAYRTMGKYNLNTQHLLCPTNPKDSEDVDLHKCNEPDSGYKQCTNRHLLNHKSLKEADIKPQCDNYKTVKWYKCSQCSYGSVLLSYVRKHVSRVHLKRDEMCHYMTTCKSNLNRHTRRHQNHEKLDG